jgi:hypothetical protein
MKKPRCEKKGTLPHPATYGFTWDLLSGRVTKFFCDDHSKGVSPEPDHISKLIGYLDERAKVAIEEE